MSIFYLIYLHAISKILFLYLRMVNRLYIIVNRLHTMINYLFTIIKQFFVVVSNLYIVINKLFTKKGYFC